MSNQLKNRLNYAVSRAILIAMGALFVTPGFAATPSAALQNAQVIATGKRIQAFRVPTTDSNGVVKYYNITIDLSILNNGTPATTSATSYVVTPSWPSNKFIPGTYTDGLGNTCTVTTAVLLGGRTEAVMSCSFSGGGSLQATWVTGLIPGHPYELDLKTAGINLLTSYPNYSWGKTVNSSYHAWWGCIGSNDIISARQINSSIAIGSYDDDNIQDCGVNLTKK